MRRATELTGTVEGVVKLVKNRLDAEGIDMPFPVRTLEAAPSFTESLRKTGDDS